MDPQRRAFLKGALRLAGGCALVLLTGAGKGFARAVAEDDRRLLNSAEGFRTRRGRAGGYLTRPRGAGPSRPAVILIHGEVGLTAHYRDLARRIALEGFVVFAPDFLSLAHDPPEDQEVARTMMEEMDEREALAIGMGAVDFLVARRDTQRRLAVVGFGWGGRMAQELALESRDVVASVSYDGDILEPQRATRLRTPLLVHLAGGGEIPHPSLPDFREALQSAGVDHAVYLYEDASPGFHDETSEAHDPAAAESAWARTMSFLADALN